ncbi:MAG: two-component system sensor histidine kinase KdpD [Verrucomicrobiales bacterium]|nr:two-component system sensor histidine kinase KdpD [Verrucomicrobiales bacterium]
MTEEKRPDPDALLAAIQKEQATQKRGRLKVFFGMAAGVGKTYAMLEAAIRQKKEGSDVLLGYVETHGRGDTQALASQLPLLPRKLLRYREINVEEFDLDAALARHPRLILVDELAHANVPGSRHPKRYQDVLELLEAGIDVYTTLNVQHVESRADTVEQITGSHMRETVPDSVLDSAEIELIDISPEDLLKRLDEGKVYVPERAVTAMINFFRAGNLTALREMALRLAAERVGQDVRDYMQIMQIPGPWKTGHRLLVAVSASPLSSQLIRWTRRLADSLDCPWLAVYVEQPYSLTPEAQTRLTRNLAVAGELGAEVITTADNDIIHGILRLARQHNVTQIIVGKPVQSGLKDYFHARSFLNRIVGESGNIDVHIVRGQKLVEPGALSSRTVPAKTCWTQYAFAFAVVASVALLNYLVNSLIGYRALALNFLFAVVILALFLGRGPVLFAATASALIWNYFFLPPRFTFRVKSLEDAMMLAMYFVVAAVIGQLVSRLRTQEQAERRRESRATALYLLTREFVDAHGLEEITKRLIAHIQEVFKADASVVFADARGHLAPNAHPSSSLILTEKEYSVAAWVFHHGKAAGRFTDNLPSSEALHLPIATTAETLGVLSVKLQELEPQTLDQRNLLEAFARQAALVIDRHRLQETSERSRLAAESERVGKTLLDSVSHEMRTPISAIASAVNAIKSSPDHSKDLLLDEIEWAVQRLNRLVRNLLDIARVEAGHLKPKLDWQDVGDLINVAVQRLEHEMSSHKVQLKVAPRLPLVRMDFVLMEQVLSNLLLNAAAYTPPGSNIVIEAIQLENELAIRVADNGPGLPERDLERIFEKFYRVPGTPAGGTGVGLSIVKGFTEAQGGRVHAANRESGGALFSIFLPVEPQPELPEDK